MAEIKLSGTRILLLDIVDPVISGDFGHLQLSFGNEQIEVQPSSGVSWDVSIEGDPADNTEDGDQFAADDIASTSIDIGDRNPDDVWEILENIRENLRANEIPYLGPTQNSNSFIATLLYMIGVDVFDHLAGATPVSITDSAAIPILDNDQFPGVAANIAHGYYFPLGGFSVFNFTLDTTDGDDFLRAGIGEDTVFGSKGSDTLFGGGEINSDVPGSPIISSGDHLNYENVTTGVTVRLLREAEGENKAVFSAEDGLNGDATPDTSEPLWVDEFSDFENVRLTDETDFLILDKTVTEAITIDGGGSTGDRPEFGDGVDFKDLNESIILDDDSPLQLRNFEQFIGSAHNDQLELDRVEELARQEAEDAGETFEASDLSINGFEGSDVIAGGSGDDRLEGHAGADTLYGGDGLDRFISQDGNDSFVGGAGADYYDFEERFDGAANDDLIYIDEEAGTDAISRTYDSSWFSENLSIGNGLFFEINATFAASGFSDTFTDRGIVHFANATEDDIDFSYQFDESDKQVFLQNNLIAGFGLIEQFTIITGDVELTNRNTGSSIVIPNVGVTAFVQQHFREVDGQTVHENYVLTTKIYSDFKLGFDDGETSITYGRNNWEAVIGNITEFIDPNNPVSGSISLNSEEALEAHLAARGVTADHGTKNDDDISGGEDTETVFAGGGEDNLNLGGGADIAYGQSGNDVIIGGEGPDELYGGSGLDRLQGEGGDDTLYGGSDHDGVHGGSGNDSLYGGSGNDTITGGDGADTVYAGRGSDDIAGENGDDVIHGDDGDDEIFGDHHDGLDPASGNDTLFGGLGTDYIYGGAGDDELFGGAFNDSLFGGSGSDLLNGDGGTDSLLGGSGSDLLMGDAGNDHLAGQDGNDTLYGGFGVDEIFGDSHAGLENSEGIDVLFGGFDTDYLYGGGLDDSLYGGGGNDFLRGGTGSNLVDGGDGRDTANYRNIATGFVVNLTSGTASDLSGAWTDNVINIENVVGSLAADTIIGDESANVLNGDDGDDLISGAGGDDSIFGGEGVDRAQFDLSFSSYTLTVSDNVLHVSSGGSEGTDAVFNDVEEIIFSDQIVAVDLYLATPDQTITGSDGDDVLSGAGEEDTIYAQDGNDTVSGFDDADSLSGGDDNDVIFGGDGNDNVDGGAHDDTLYGGSGDDTLVGGFGTDTFFGGLGTDTLSFSYTSSDIEISIDSGTAWFPDSQILETFESIENIFAGNGNDTITGSSSSNVLDGLDGDDLLFGAGGADSFFGGQGLDTVVFDGSFDEYELSVTGHAREDIDEVISVEELSTGFVSIIFADVELISFADRDAPVYQHITPHNRDFVGGRDGDVIEGTDLSFGPDSILGGAGNDHITALAGNDDIAGQDGSDVIFGGDGNDNIFGEGHDGLPQAVEGGSDTIFGGAGDDRLFGGDGDDTVLGDGGNDEVSGRSGDDWLAGGFGFDTFFGGTGNDTVDFTHTSLDIDVSLIRGTALFSGSDTHETLDSIENLTGGLGNDILTGDAGSNVLYGDQGDDTLIGGGGDDVLGGGTGVDVAVLAGNLSDFDFMQIGDAIFATHISSQSTDQILDTVEILRFDDGDANFSEILTLAAQDLTLNGTNADDTLNGGLGDDLLDGAAGDDTLYGLGGADSLYGGSNRDVLDGGDGDDLLDGGSFTDSIYGAAGDDSLLGGTGGDRLYGGDGDDRLDGGRHIDNYYGGGGSDLFVLSDDGSRDQVHDFELGFDKIDATHLGPVDFSDFAITQDGSWAKISYASADGQTTAEIWVRGNGVDASLIAADHFTDNVNDTGSGPSFNLITGTTGDDTLQGTDQSDRIIGDAGADSLSGAAGNDDLLGDAQADIISGGLGDDTVSGGSFNDELAGDAGSDTLNGGSGGDTLFGGDGDDRLDGDTGLDRYYGGSGSDIFVLSSGGSRDQLYDFELNTDKIDASHIASITFDDLAIVQSGVWTQISYAHPDGTTTSEIWIRGSGVSAQTINSSHFIGDGFDASGGPSQNIVQGTNANETLDGTDQADLIYGEGGSDLISGFGGDDEVYGGSGADQIYGGVGDDYLQGNDGLDRYYGGAGSDVFVFASDNKRDQLYDFTKGEDKIDLSDTGATSFADISFSTPNGTWTELAIDNGNVVHLLWIETSDIIGANQLDATDFILS